jgi:hypothetical protein
MHPEMREGDRDYEPRRAEPLRLRGWSRLRMAITLARMPRWRRNRLLAPRERCEPGYAILNDNSHDFMALHYYIWQDDQERVSSMSTGSSSCSASIWTAAGSTATTPSPIIRNCTTSRAGAPTVGEPA